MFRMIQRQEQKHIITKVAGQQIIVADVFAAIEAELLSVRGCVEELFYGEGGAFDGMAQ